MNNEISNKPCGCGNCEPMCTTCGRPWIVCKGECGCNKPYCNKVNFCEYGRAVPGCIRERAPECPMQAVIPSVVVESTSNLKNLADCFVHVTDINTTFYIDDKHRMMITWAGPVEYNNYDLDTNTLGLRSQFLLDFANDCGAYYDATGEYKKFNFDKSLSFTMQYDAGTQGNALPGWSYSDLKEGLIQLGPDSTLFKRNSLYHRDDMHPVTFINDSTGEVITPEALYALLLDGADVTLNHVPIGVIWKGVSEADPTPYADGIHLTKFYSRVENGEHSYGVIGFSGSASVSIMPTDTEAWISTQLSFIIDGHTSAGEPADNVPEYNGITVQGFDITTLN